MKRNRLLFLLAFPLYFFSCKPMQKIPAYLENVTDSTGKGEVKVPDLKIQKNDLLSIQILSLSTRPDLSDAIYNQPSAAPGAASGGASTTGYLVDNQGNIEHHRLGTIHAEGLTKQQLAAEIRKRLTEPVELLKNPTVIIRFLNFRVLVLGQVGKEGPVTVPGERLTILEAVGLAGGIPDYGKKEGVKVIREVDGKRETGVVDLTSSKLFESPYYNLMQNDVVVVEPSKQKYKEQEQSKNFQKISMAMTLVTSAAIIYNILIRN